MLSHFWKGTSLWRAVNAADKSEGQIRFVLEEEYGDMISNKLWYYTTRNSD